MNMSREMIKNNSLGRLLFTAVLFTLLCIMPSDLSALIGMEQGEAPKKIALSDISGRPVNVSGLFGKRPVILVFWELTLDNSFINYSLDELLFLNGFYDKFHDSAGLEIFGIYTPEETGDIPEKELEKVRSLVKLNRIKFPVLIDRGFETFREYGVIALPSTVMVDRTGRIKFIYPSFPLAARKLFSGQIEELAGVAKAASGPEAVKEAGHDSRSNRLYHYALQMYKRGLPEQALSPLKKSLALDPNYSWAHNLMGIILWKAGNFEGALAEFEAAIKSDRYNAAAHMNYGLLLFENDQYDEAEKQFNISAEMNSAAAETHYALGLLYRKTGRPGEAVNELKTALSLFEKDGAPAMVYDPSVFHRISACYALSELYAESGDINNALALLQKAARAALGIEPGTGRGPVKKTENLMIYE